MSRSLPVSGESLELEQVMFSSTTEQLYSGQTEKDVFVNMLKKE